MNFKQHISYYLSIYLHHWNIVTLQLSYAPSSLGHIVVLRTTNSSVCEPHKIGLNTIQPEYNRAEHTTEPNTMKTCTDKPGTTKLSTTQPSAIAQSITKLRIIEPGSTFESSTIEQSTNELSITELGLNENNATVLGTL